MRQFLINSLFLMAGSLGPLAASAEVHTQTFQYEWERSVWDYYGTVSALEWRYAPYEAWPTIESNSEEPAELQKVIVSLNLNGSRDNTDDLFKVRYSFFADNGRNYQFYRQFSIPTGTQEINFSESFVYTDIADLERWKRMSDPLSSSGYFETQTINARHLTDATVTLTFIYNSADIILEDMISKVIMSVVIDEKTKDQLRRKLGAALDATVEGNYRKACGNLNGIPFLKAKNVSLNSESLQQELKEAVANARIYLSCKKL